MILTEGILIGIAGVAITLIGFSGVVSALERQGAGKATPAERLQLYALVVPSTVTLFGVFFCLCLSIAISNEDFVWRASNLAVFAGHGLGVGLFIRQGRATHSFRAGHAVGSTATFVVLIGTLLSGFNLIPWHQFTFLLGLVLGIGVSLHNFILLLFSERDPVEPSP